VVLLATHGQPYSLQLQAIGGTPPYSWNKYGSVGMGKMPPGLHLSRSGPISGTPGTASTYILVVKCLDAIYPYKTQGTLLLVLTS
jgi:hypothetical protein